MAAPARATVAMTDFILIVCGWGFWITRKSDWGQVDYCKRVTEFAAGGKKRQVWQVER